MGNEQQVNHVVAMVGNPSSDKGRGAKVSAQVRELLETAGKEYGFSVVDLTGSSFDDSLQKAQTGQYDYLVVIGGDGMIALGANAVGCSGKPLGIVAVGSGNDFARGLDLPVNRIETAVEGIVGAIVCGTYIDVDMGRVSSLPGGYAVDSSTGEEYEDGKNHAIDRYFGGMLSCGMDASINDRANHSKLPTGGMRYLSAVLYEVKHMKHIGYHVKATLADGSIDERDIITPMLTVANSRHIGGGMEISPYSCFDDGMLDLVWMEHKPSAREVAGALKNVYNGRILASRFFGWERVRAVEITRAQDGDDAPALMADGEYVGYMPVRVQVQDHALRVMVPPAVQAQVSDAKERSKAAIERDGRDQLTGKFID